MLDYLNGQKSGQVPPTLRQEFVRLLAQEAAQRATPSSLRTATRLFQLATLPAKPYLGVQKEQLEELWPSLARLAFIHDVEAWQKQYGLLPTWAVLMRPIWLTLADSDHISVKVYPDLMFRQLNQGIGYAKLRVNEKEEQLYVKWLPHKDGLVQLILALPDSPPDSAFAELDELDMWPIYQCTGCRRLIGQRGWLSEKDELYKQHIHNRRNLRLYDMVKHISSDSPLIPRASHHKRGSWLQYTYPQTQYIERDRVQSYLDDPGSLSKQENSAHDAESNNNSILAQSYHHASQKWVERYHADRHIAPLLDEFITNDHLAERFKELEEWLFTLAYKTKMPMLAATGRFLEAFEAIEDQNPLLELDKRVLLLSLLLRMSAYYPQQATALCRRIRLNEKELTQILNLVHSACPELLDWGLT